MTLTGRLKGKCNGRPVELKAQGQELTLQVGSLWSAWALRSNISAATKPILRTLVAKEIRLGLNIGSWWKIELLPNPSLVGRLLIPDLHLP